MPVGQGKTDFSLQVSLPVKAVRCLAGPSAPRPSCVCGDGESVWRLINHLALNYLSLTDRDARRGAAGLRQLLQLYSEIGDPSTRKQIEGVRSIQNQPVVRRSPRPGPIAFARGLELTLTLDESGFEGTGAFLLGAVLDEFFAQYVSVNSFTETILRTTDRGEVMRWPAKIGRRHIL
jgi:type VI secretion system protein ImpG